MSLREQALPNWTWGDLEAALNGFSPTGEDDLVRTHLLRGLMDDAESLSPRDFLKQVLSAGWVMAQMGARTLAEDGSATSDRQAGGVSGF